MAILRCDGKKLNPDMLGPLIGKSNKNAQEVLKNMSTKESNMRKSSQENKHRAVSLVPWDPATLASAALGA